MRNFFKKKTKIQLVHLTGAIAASESGNMLNRQDGTEELLETLHEIKQEDAIKGVLLRIDSPGGTAGASQEVAELVSAIRKKGVPVVASIADMACSGAYMVASACDYIFANRLSITGSIGVIMQIPNYAELSQKLGVTYTTIKSGEMKDIGNPVRPMTQEEHTYLSDMAAEAHREFIALVQQNRQIRNVEQMTDGRFVSAMVAKENNLIDAFGTFYDALDYLYERLGVDEENVDIIEDEKRPGLLSRLLDLKSLGGALLPGIRLRL